MGFAPTIQFRKLTWPSSPKLTTYSPSSWSSPQHLAHTLGIEPSQSDLESNSPNLGTLACVCRSCSRPCSIVSHTYLCLLPPTNLADCHSSTVKNLARLGHPGQTYIVRQKGYTDVATSPYIRVLRPPTVEGGRNVGKTGLEPARPFRTNRS